jgi:hypothetical protein
VAPVLAAVVLTVVVFVSGKGSGVLSTRRVSLASAKCFK